MVSPVKENEEYDVEIESVGAKGDGVTKVNGYAIFVPGAKKGDQVRIKITRALPSYGFAEIASSESEEDSD